MIGIEAIGTYLPARRIDNLERAAGFDCDEEFVENKLGVLEISQAAEDEDAFSLAANAVEDLRARTGLEMDEIEVLVLVTQTPGKLIPHVSARLHGEIGLTDRCACFDISLGCSGYVYALTVVKALMEAQGFRRGLIVTSDPYSKIVDAGDRNTAMLFGDAATATLLSDRPVFEIGRTTMKTRGASHRELMSTDSGNLHMNGRAVFTFCAQNVPPDIREAAELNGVTVEDIDLFLVHQGSKFIVDTIRNRLGLSEEKMPFGAVAYGNTVSSSIPLLLAERVASPESRRIMISGFGVGLSWASSLLTRVA
ncbi:MAG: ketoacyl-ACP synthase III [Verrucomicrobiae bacterium]|nr:ketoacyl-ACP synthase III [Verrucomicrobiae bacterium]